MAYTSKGRVVYDRPLNPMAFKDAKRIFEGAYKRNPTVKGYPRRAHKELMVLAMYVMYGPNFIYAPKVWLERFANTIVARPGSIVSFVQTVLWILEKFSLAWIGKWIIDQFHSNKLKGDYTTYLHNLIIRRRSRDGPS